MSEITTHLARQGFNEQDSPISKVLLRLYGSLTDHEGFYPFLKQLAQFANAYAGVLVCLNKSPLRVNYLWNSGLPEAFILAYREQGLIEQDAVFKMAVHAKPGRFDSVLPHLERLAVDEGYQTYEDDFCLIDSAWLVVDADDDEVVVLAMQRTTQQGPYQQQELAALEQLTPHIRQAVALYRQMDKQIEKASSLASVVNALPRATVILNQYIEVIHANPAALNLLAEALAVSLDNKRLMFRKNQEQLRFVELATESVRASIGITPYSAGTLFVPRDGKPDLVFCITPLELSSQHRGGALLTIYDPLERQFPSGKLIANYFDLSDAEARLCEDLIQGLSLKAIADRQYKSEATVRSYLKQVYQKTGYSRQGELISAVLSTLMQ